MSAPKAPTTNGVYINLPVKDLPKSIAFFTALGFGFNAKFTDATATCMILGENSAVMLLTHDKFRMFTSLPLADAFKQTEVLVALSLTSRAEVDTLVDAVIANGGEQVRPTEDHGFMYTRAFRDLDGHIWEPFYMDISAFPNLEGG
jgi:predicted lactoylglutathione lyase